MSSHSDELERWFTGVIYGTRRGLGPTLLRGFLRFGALLFSLASRWRLRSLKKRKNQLARLAVPVVSVGNITMGGTGKTPVVEYVARELQKRGRRVAILSRGYKSDPLDKPQRWIHPEKGHERTSPPKIVSDGREVLLEARYGGDEPHMLAKNLPGVAVIVDPDRARGGRFAVGELHCDCLLLDDGMQNFRLAHTFDFVLLDQGKPFGLHGLLPRGTLREFPSQLQRADLILLTKCQGPTEEAVLQKIHRHAPGRPLVECRHEPRTLRLVHGPASAPSERPLTDLQGAFVAATSGIAFPQSFEDMLRHLGAQVEFHNAFSDHYQFHQSDLDNLMKRALRRGVNFIVTTEKDAVRMPRPEECDLPIYFLRIEIEILSGHAALHAALDQLAHPPTIFPEQWTRERVLAPH